MREEATTIARPYAEAVFALAQKGDTLEQWEEMLAYLAELVQDPSLSKLIDDPLFSREKLSRLMLSLVEDRFDVEGQNLVKLLIEYDRLAAVPQIGELYKQLKAESQRVLQVHIRTSYPLEPPQEQTLAAVLKKNLGRDITITTEEDPDLIGGVYIRAGDLVIDGSVRGQLQQLAHDLGI